MSEWGLQELRHCGSDLAPQGIGGMEGHVAVDSRMHLRRRQVASAQGTILCSGVPARVFLAALCLVFMSVPSWPSQWGSAPPAQAATSGASAFADHLHAKFLHPRCLNCHHFNAPDGLGSQPLPGEAPTAPPHKELSNGDCRACHTQAVTGVPPDVKPSQQWRSPGRDMDWTGMTPQQTCELIKQANQGAFADPADMTDHLTQDRLILWAVTRGRVPPAATPQARDRVPGGRQEWLTQVDAWIKGGMQCD
jgi:hypothetical protein